MTQGACVYTNNEKQFDKLIKYYILQLELNYRRKKTTTIINETIKIII